MARPFTVFAGAFLICASVAVGWSAVGLCVAFAGVALIVDGATK